MEKVIWKYNIPILDIIKIEMPKGAKVLSVQNQNDEIALWMHVNPKEKSEIREFQIIGTGHELPSLEKPKRKYIGTCQIGIYVWHVFELITN